MYLSNLYPTPNHFVENEAQRFTFGGAVTATISGLDVLTAQRVKTLWYRFSCDACELNLVEGGEGFRFTIGNADGSLDTGDEYAIHADPAGVCVVSKDEAGLLNGIKTLVQLICPVELDYGKESFYISAADIHDAPTIGMRAIHVCIFIGTQLYTIEQAIHLAGFLKFTHVILEFWGTFRYDCQPALYWGDRSFSKAELRELVTLANSYGMGVIPMINHFGHATQSRGCNGRHVTLNRNPRLSRLFEPDGWTWCISNPDTYKLLAEMRAEQMEWAGDGKYFHLGFDEAGSFGTCDICRKRVPHELVAEFINRLTEDVCKTGRRPIMWHDMLIRRDQFPEGCYMEANGHRTHKALDLLDRRIIMADWNYAYQNGFNPTTPYFIEKGFDTVICPWDNHENIRSITADVKKYGAMGLIMTTWHHLPNFLSGGAYWANCAWSAGERNFGTRYTENACLLRRLHDAQGRFEESGWGFCEVEK